MGSEFAPPPLPPPLLSDEEILSLARIGSLSVTLPDHLTKHLSALSLESEIFFKQTATVKAELYPKAYDTELGFYTAENEKEYLTLRCHNHGGSKIETIAAQIWSDVAAYMVRILSDLAREMELPHDVWDSLLDGCLEMPPGVDQMTPTLLRLFRYYPGSGFAAEHTDLGLLTLCVGNSCGLQVSDRSTDPQRWVNADGAVILAGDVLRILSGNRIRAGLHRVVENPNGRSSIVFALRPSLRNHIDLSTFGLEGVIGSDELWRELRSRKLNINATKDSRDRQREDLKARKAQVEQAG